MAKIRVSVQIVDPEMQVWVQNAARHFDLTAGQFLEMVMHQAFKDLYGKSFAWKGWKLAGPDEIIMKKVNEEDDVW